MISYKMKVHKMEHKLVFERYHSWSGTSIRRQLRLEKTIGDANETIKLTEKMYDALVEDESLELNGCSYILFSSKKSFNHSTEIFTLNVYLEKEATEITLTENEIINLNQRIKKQENDYKESAREIAEEEYAERLSKIRVKALFILPTSFVAFGLIIKMLCQ